MPAQTLLEVNPEELFQKHNINEIKEIQIKIQNEIEKKREELRTLVGEKCRDLLKAADTITEMKDTAQSIIVGINQMKILCESLQDKKFTGFNSENIKVKKFYNNAEEISKVIELKILLTLPEQIWTAIDNKSYLLATELFLFATHIHLGLEVSNNAKKISNKYPVLEKQWEVISSCKKKIIEGAENELKIIKLSYQKAAECLCSLFLLKVMPYEKLLNQFLQLRILSLEEILKSEELARTKLKLTVELLQNTLAVLFVCFFEKAGKKCLIQRQLLAVIGQEAKPTLSKIIQVCSLPERYISPLISNFHPETSSKFIALSEDYIKTTLTKWLENVKNILSAELTQILFLIDDIKRLHKIIKEDIFSLEYPEEWNEIVESLFSDSSLNIYHRFIKTYVTQRVKTLIELTWQNNVNNVLISLNKMDEDTLKDRGKQPENDIRWFVWKENKIDSEKELKLKTLGHTSRVMELCDQMNFFLNQLLDDVKLYVGEDSSTKSKGKDEDLILPFLNSCSCEMLNIFAQSVKESLKKKEVHDESNIIIRARFLSSLTTLCPGLENCIKYNLIQDFEESQISNKWQEQINFLNNESIELWRRWSDLKSSKIRDLIKSKLDPKISLRNLLKCKPLSEIVTIEEQTEDDTTVKSDLRVPSQPSLPLQDLLFQICQQLGAVAPHTLPREIHQELVNIFLEDILKHYQEWSKSDIIYQSQAWQILLDIKFLTLLIMTKEKKDLSQLVCENLEKIIDPFDLDVYYPHLQNSVKKSTLKLQGTFGILVNFTEKLPVFNGLKLSAQNKVEEPNLLAMSSSVPWFPLLPVTNFGTRRPDSSSLDYQDPSSNKKLSEKTQVRTKDKESKKESVTGDFFKSAGAFFESMTGGWS